jgi:hypothetical protein
LVVTANVVPSSPILVALMMEVVLSSETSILKESHVVTLQKTVFFLTTNHLPWFELEFGEVVTGEFRIANVEMG